MRIGLSIAVLLACLLNISAPLQAAESLWPAQDTPISNMIGNYRAVKCSYATPTAYTGHLQLESKYDQRDRTKSQLRTPSDDTRQIRDAIYTYQNGLLEAIKRFERSKTPEQTNLALACLHTWLDDWARAGAMLSPDASNTGKAVRKWFLATASSALLKVQALSNRRYRLSWYQERWLQRLADTVIREYSPRQTLKYRWFNNHDYWAAWAVASTGMLLGKEGYLAWADTTLRLAFEQMIPGSNNQYFHLPLETARGQRAVNYTHFALLPLVLLLEGLDHNGYHYSEEQLKRLDGLATFAALGVIQPDKLPELASNQEETGVHRMVWLLPWMQHFPGNTAVRQLYQRYGNRIGSYGQIGGDIRFFYPFNVKQGL